MGQFDDDFDAVDAMMSDIFASTIEIHRGSLSTTGVTSEAVSRDYDVTDYDGIITTAHSRDYVVDVGDYMISSAIVVPRKGDRIKETIAGTVHVFEVLPIGTRPCAEWSTTQKPQWVIHTKLVGTE